MNSRLGSAFFIRPTLVVAPELLGKVLVSKSNDGVVTGEITEVEAYLGDTDPASHAFKGQTLRNQAMWLEGGHWYVYFIYGKHLCLNIVTENQDTAGAILIRAVRPIEGIELIKKKRGHVSQNVLTNGPGKVAQAFGISRDFNGTDSTTSQQLWLEDRGLVPKKIVTSKRIGVSKGMDFEWRFNSEE